MVVIYIGTYICLRDFTQFIINFCNQTTICANYFLPLGSMLARSNLYGILFDSVESNIDFYTLTVQPVSNSFSIYHLNIIY